MKVGIIKTALNEFHYILKDNSHIEEKERSRRGTVAFNFPKENPDGEKTILEIKLSVELEEDKFTVDSEIVGIFEVPNIDYGNDKSDENLRELVDSIMPALLDKFRVYYGLFSQEAMNYAEIPNLNFEF